MGFSTIIGNLNRLRYPIPPPQYIEGQTPVRLSKAFLRGYLGGLPDNF